MAKPHPRFKHAGLEILLTQWRVIEFLEPTWMFLKYNSMHRLTRCSLVRRGWVECLKYEGFMMMRLTKAGLELRDSIYIRRARRLDRKLGWYRSTSWLYFDSRLRDPI